MIPCVSIDKISFDERRPPDISSNNKQNSEISLSVFAKVFKTMVIFKTLLDKKIGLGKNNVKKSIYHWWN